MGEMYRKRKRDMKDKPNIYFEHFWYYLIKNQNNLPFKILSYEQHEGDRYNYTDVFYFELQFQWETIVVGQGKQVEDSDDWAQAEEFEVATCHEKDTLYQRDWREIWDICENYKVELRKRKLKKLI